MDTPAVQAPMTPEQIVDLRRRVLAGEEVSNDELRHALSTLALTRVTSSAVSKAKADSKVSVKIDVGSAFAAFKQKSMGGSAPSTGGDDKGVSPDPTNAPA